MVLRPAQARLVSVPQSEVVPAAVSTVVLSTGAPRGAQNGNYRNGEWTAGAIEERRWLRSLHPLIRAA